MAPPPPKSGLCRLRWPGESHITAVTLSTAGNEYSRPAPLRSGPAAEARLDPDSIGSLVTYDTASLPSSSVAGSDRQVYTQVMLMQTFAPAAHLQARFTAPLQMYLTPSVRRPDRRCTPLHPRRYTAPLLHSCRHT